MRSVVEDDGVETSSSISTSESMVGGGDGVHRVLF